MSKTIKVIDLLNKIANGEEVPNIIKTNGIDIWIYDKEYKRYYLKQDDYITLTFDVTDKLNDTVEIIEEEQEIDIQGIEEFEIDKNNYIQTELGAFKTRKMDIAFLNKMNKLTKAVKQLDNQINNK